MSDTLLARLIEVDFDFPPNTSPSVVLALFDEFYFIKSISAENDALITLHGNACLQANQLVYLTGTATCPKSSINQEYTIQQATNDTIKVLFDASAHGSENFGIVGLVEDGVRSYSAALYEPVYEKSNFNIGKAVKTESNGFYVDHLNRYATKARINNKEFNITGISERHCCDGDRAFPKGKYGVEVDGTIEGEIAYASTWAERPSKQLGPKRSDLLIKKIDKYNWQIDFPELIDTPLILDIKGYVAGLVEDKTIRGYVNYGD